MEPQGNPNSCSFLPFLIVRGAGPEGMGFDQGLGFRVVFQISRPSPSPEKSDPSRVVLPYFVAGLQFCT